MYGRRRQTQCDDNSSDDHSIRSAKNLMSLCILYMCNCMKSVNILARNVREYPIHYSCYFYQHSLLQNVFLMFSDQLENNRH